MGDSVFINGRAAVHKGSRGRATAFPDVCLCPPGPVPTPLSNTVVAADLAGGAATVFIEGNPAGVSSSYFAKSTGNEMSRPTGGGIVTHGVKGKAMFRSHSPNVFIEGVPAVRHLDLLTHNHVAAVGNTPPAVWTSTMLPPKTVAAPRFATKTAGEEGTSWIEIEVVDETGAPLVSAAWRLQSPKGTVVEGRLLSGGRFKVKRLTAGKCRLSFPDVDADPAAAKPLQGEGAPSGAIVYVAGRALDLAVEAKHKVVVFGQKVLWLTFSVLGREHGGNEDKLVLRGDDRAYEVSRTLAANKTKHDDGLTLSFPNIRRGRHYTLTHEPADGSAARTIFENRSFEALFPDGDLIDDAQAGAPEVPRSRTEERGGEDAAEIGVPIGVVSVIARDLETGAPLRDLAVRARQGSWEGVARTDSSGRATLEPPDLERGCEVEAERPCDLQLTQLSEVG